MTRFGGDTAGSNCFSVALTTVDVVLVTAYWQLRKDIEIRKEEIDSLRRQSEEHYRQHDEQIARQDEQIRNLKDWKMEKELNEAIENNKRAQ